MNTLDEYNAQPGMITASEWCKLHGTTMTAMAEAQEEYERLENDRIRAAGGFL